MLHPKGLVVVADAISEAEPSKTPSGALAHVANQPIFHHVLEALESAGVHEIVVVVEAGVAGVIRRSLAAKESGPGTGVELLVQPGPVDLGQALRLAAPLIDAAPCIVHDASGLLAEPLGPLIGRLDGNAPEALLMVHHGSAPDQHLTPAAQRMLHIAELDPTRSALGVAGVCLFGHGALLAASVERPDDPGAADLASIASGVIAAGGSLRVHVAEGWRHYAGDALDLLELNRIALDRLEPNRQPSQNGNRIEGRVHIHESASVRTSVIVGPTVIGAHAQIADAYIGPYTSLADGVRIEGAEIERSIICANASVMHVGGRLVASVVGREARIFRDFSLPRALRLRVGDGTEVALC